MSLTIAQEVFKEAKNLGYYIVPKCLEYSETWQKCTENQRKIFLYILSHCAYEPMNWNEDGKTIILKPGQYVTSYRKLAEDTGTTLDSVRSFVKCRLFKDGFINQARPHDKPHTTPHQRMTISICNYECYTLAFYENPTVNTTLNPTAQLKSKKTEKCKKLTPQLTPQFFEHLNNSFLVTYVSGKNTQPHSLPHINNIAALAAYYLYQKKAAANNDNETSEITPPLRGGPNHPNGMARCMPKLELNEVANRDRAAASFSKIQANETYEKSVHLENEVYDKTVQLKPMKLESQGKQEAPSKVPQKVPVYPCLENCKVPLSEEQKRWCSNFPEDRVKACVAKTNSAKCSNYVGYLKHVLNNATDEDLEAFKEKKDKESDVFEFISWINKAFQEMDLPFVYTVNGHTIEIPFGVREGRTQKYKLELESLKNIEIRNKIKEHAKQFRKEYYSWQAAQKTQKN